MFSKKIKANAVVTAGQIAIDMTNEGYDSKTISEFLQRLEQKLCK